MMIQDFVDEMLSSGKRGVNEEKKIHIQCGITCIGSIQQQQRLISFSHRLFHLPYKECARLQPNGLNNWKITHKHTKKEQKNIYRLKSNDRICFICKNNDGLQNSSQFCQLWHSSWFTKRNGYTFKKQCNLCFELNI